MTNLINEAQRMQQLAGILTESQLNEIEYAGIKKVPTSGDDYQLTIDDEKWNSDGRKGGGEHIIAFTKNGAFYVNMQGSWDWKTEKKSNEVKDLLKKYVEDNKIEKLTPESSRFLGIQAQPQAESLDIESVVNEALKSVRKK